MAGCYVRGDEPRSELGRTPLDESSACRIGLCLHRTTQLNDKDRIHALKGFEPTISASSR
jgi:hypothetical protein